MALTPVAYTAPGCSHRCPSNVVAKSDTFAYASIEGVSLYKMERKTLPDLSSTASPATANGNGPSGGASNNNTSTVDITTFQLQSLFGNGISGPITAFDYNDEVLACLCAQSKSVAVWNLSDSEPLTSKRIPGSLASMFNKEGGPSTMCVAGKFHLIFGTTTGRLISLNTKDGLHDPKSVTIPPPAVSPATTPLASQLSGLNSFTPGAGGRAVEGVEAVAVSSARPDLVACGTADGTLCFLTLSGTTGLTVSSSLTPFPPPAKERERLLAPDPLPVTAVAFDPNTPHQAVVASREGGLALCDMNRPGAAALVYDTKDKVSGLAWAVGENGTFYTVSADSSVIRKWNTSSRAATATIGSVVEAPLGIRGIACMDKDRVVLTLTSGAVKVFNITAAADSGAATTPLEFETLAGHTDAVLTSRFSRHDKDLLASAGADGTIRVWNVRSSTLQSTIEVGPVLVYSIDWSHNGKYIIAALGSGEVVQYNVATQRQGWRTTVFPDLVYRVVWSSAGDSSVVVATSRSGIAVLSARDGQIARRFSSPGGAVYSVDIEPTKAKTLAVGCNNSKVYVYNLTSSSDDPILTLSGHSDVVSDVAYNPTAPQFLLSGSYDGTLRVWDLSTNDSHTISVNARILKGHSDRVKSLAWCSLAPYLAVSGSVDATVRLWDVRNGVCVTAVRGHTAEVLAITTHPERPLVFVSSGRDASLVTWHLSLLRQVYLDAALGALDQCIVADAASAVAVATGTNVSVSIVVGSPVQKLAKELREGAAASKPTERMERIAGFFEHPLGSMDLSQLAGFAVDPSTYAVDGRAAAVQLVIPTAKLIDSRRARALQVAEKAHGKTATSAGAAYQRTRLIEAAEEMLRVGSVKEHCDLMIEAEAWDRAIAAAPAVSRAYWREVCLKAAAAMEAVGDAKAVGYYIMAEESAKAAALMTRLSQGSTDAAVVIARACPQRSPGAATDAEPASQAAVDRDGATQASQRQQQTRVHALWRHRNPRLIAAAHVANGNNDEAVRTLLHAGDVSLAHLLVHTIPLREQASIDNTYHHAMLLGARLRQWDTALACATRQSNPYHSLATLLAMFQFTHGKHVSRLPTHSVTSAGMANFQAINDKLKAFYDQVKGECTKLGLPMDAAAVQQRHASDGLASQNQIAAMVLQSDPMMGPATSGQILQSIHGFVESLLGVALQDVDGANAGFYLKQAYNVIGYVALPISLPRAAGALRRRRRDRCPCRRPSPQATPLQPRRALVGRHLRQRCRRSTASSCACPTSPRRLCA